MNGRASSPPFLPPAFSRVMATSQMAQGWMDGCPARHTDRSVLNKSGVLTQHSQDTRPLILYMYPLPRYSSYITVVTGLSFLHMTPVMPVHRPPQDDWLSRLTV